MPNHYHSNIMTNKAKTKKKKYNNLKNPETGLTIKQQRLVDKFEGKGSLKKAAEYAGLSFSYACGVVTLPHIKKAIDDKEKKLQEKCEIDQQWVLERYKKLTDYKITDFFDDDGNMKPLSEIPDAAIYAICGLDVNRKTVTLGDESDIETFIQKFKLSDKKGTLDSIAKMLGLNVEKGGLGGLGGEGVKEVKIIFVNKEDVDED